MFQDGAARFFNGVEEGPSESWALEVVVSRCIVEFTLGERMKRNPAHSAESVAGVPQHFVGSTRTVLVGVRNGVAALGFLGPEAFVFFIGESLETLEQFLCEAGPRLRVELHCF